MRNVKKNIISALLILMIIATSWPLLRGIAFGRYVNPNNVGIHPTLLEHQGTAAESPSGFSPAQIRTAYNLPSSGGSGTIAIIDAFDDPTVLDDLNVFSSQFNLPPVNSTNFEKHMMAPSIPENDWWAAEISLDVQWAHAIAPSAKIWLVEAQNGSRSSLYSAVDYARNRADVVAISMSWGEDEYYEETDQDFHFTSDYGASFFASSGDDGAFNYLYPAASPNVIAVGGTVLTLNVDGSVASETGWDRSGGFRSWREPEPLCQLAYGVLSIGSYRVVPDVSYHAVNYSTYESFNPSESGWFNETGTSAGAPQWAAIESLGLSCSDDRFYKIASGPLYQSDFRDITSGNNGQPAGPGFDYVTGLGSPLTTAFNYLSNASACDINNDGKVNILDAILMANAFGSQPSDLNWNTLADVNNDYKVNILDEIICGLYFGTSGTLGLSSTSSPAGAMTQSGPSVLIDPSQVTVFKGEVFSVNVNVTGVTDLQGWEFKLYWNSTVLNCTNAAVVTPAIWQGNTLDYGSGLEANYNSTHGMFWKAEAANYPAPSFNGSMTIATLTFQAVQPGTTSLTLMDTLLGNSTAQPIPCSVSSSSVTVYYGRYMRSDIQTVNGLNAYKLNLPESTSYAYKTQSGSGYGAYWGIRAWVRYSNGTEQEISLDAQTGTPKAVVSRGSGSGLQSGTVTVAQTGLQLTDSLVVRVYVQVGESDWTLCATFTTEQLQTTTLQAATWTVYYYTYAAWNRYTQMTTAKFYWGTTTYYSRIQNLPYG